MTHIKRIDEMANTQQNNLFDAVKNELTIGMPYNDAENILRKHGLLLSEYGNVQYNKQDHCYAEYNLTGERGQCPKIVLYYTFVKVPNKRDSWVAGDTYDIEFYAEDGVIE